jgi:endonuclease YncB( thermonuclease family)
LSRVRWIKNKNFRDFQIVVVAAIVCMIGALAIQQFVKGQLQQTDLYAVLSSIGKPFGLCHESYQADCVIDGDTISYSGHLIRTVDYDVPEIGEPTCSSSLALRHQVTLRLLDILNSGPVAVIRVTDRDVDRYGRELRLLTVNGRSVGETLIAEHLAMPGGRRTHFWCGFWLPR